MSQPVPDDAPPAAFSRTIPLIVAATFFMELLDGSIVTTSLPAIAATFGEPPLTLAASISVYLVAMAVFVPTAGWASERFGARRLFAGAVTVFTLASLLCGLSPSVEALIAARALQGIAAAFMAPVGRLIVLRETPKHRIIDAIAMITWPALIAPVLGPPLGGFITTYASWRWIFLINLPLGVLGVLLVLRFVPRHDETVKTPFDAVGFLLTAVALAASIQGLLSLGEGGADRYAGASLVALGAVAGIAAVRHARSHPSPMLDLSAVAVRTFAFCTVTGGVLSRIAINTGPFLLPLMFQIGFGRSAFEAGGMLFVYMLGNLAAKSVTTPILRRFGFRRVLVGNGLVGAAAIAGCGLLSPDVAMPAVYAVLLAAGLTRSMHFTSLATLAFADISPGQRAGASALVSTMQQVAMAVAVAFAATALALFVDLRGGSDLVLADFRHALFAAAALMAVGALLALRLPKDAGAEVSRRG